MRLIKRLGRGPLYHSQLASFKCGMSPANMCAVHVCQVLALQAMVLIGDTKQAKRWGENVLGYVVTIISTVAVQLTSIKFDTSEIITPSL